MTAKLAKEWLDQVEKIRKAREVFDTALAALGAAEDEYKSASEAMSAASRAQQDAREAYNKAREKYLAVLPDRTPKPPRPVQVQVNQEFGDGSSSAPKKE